MATPTPFDTLTNRQKDICSYGGAFGILLSLTCLIQHMMITRTHWLTFVMLCIYFFAALSFFLLALQKHIAPLLLIISTAFAFIAQVILMRHALFSLVVVLLLMYHVVVVVIMYVEQIPKRLKLKAQLLREEEENWRDKI